MLNSNLSFNQVVNKQVLIITGLSGAGKTSLMRALEDFGFYCVDNLPLPLLSSFLKLAFQVPNNLIKVALGIDSRGQRFLSDFIHEVEQIRAQEIDNILLKVIFLRADENTLLRRFQETRRNHPLADKQISLLGAINKEKELLDPIKTMSNIVLDTDVFNIHQLRKWVKEFLVDDKAQEMLVNLVSFGFKFGLPMESNLVYDLRFLPNPYFVPELKPLDGRSDKIQNYLFKQKPVLDYWERLRDFLKFSVQNSYKEGRFFVNVAIGCTGGKHRSVAFVERILKEKWSNIKFLVHHRDLEKE